MLDKLGDTLRTFAANRPTLGQLRRSRRRRFDEAHVILPSNAVVGEPVTATTLLWDEYERRLTDFDGEFAVDSTDAAATYPETLSVVPGHDGRRQAPDVTFETPGIQYLTLWRDGQRFVSNPVVVSESDPERRLYWGDIHLHSQFSDGAGSMAKGLRFGRDEMDLDVAAYADHDTMGFFIPPKLQRRRMRRRYFDEMKDVVDDFYDPGEFVTLFAYEWTRQPHKGGHVNVYYESPDDAELFDSISGGTNTYEKLWRRLREWRENHDDRVLTAPHHSAEGIYPFDFASTDYDDEMAPLVQVYSQWGSSMRPEADGNPKPMTMGEGEVGTPGHYVHDALRMGHRVGFVASSDYHGPRPGLSNIHLDPHLPTLSELREDGLGWGHVWRVWNESSYAGGLVAFHATDLTRETIFDALENRQVYGTSQPHRIVAEFSIDGVAVSDPTSDVEIDTPDASREIEYRVAGTAPLERVTVVKNTRDWHVIEGTDDEAADLDSYVVEGSMEDDAPVEGMQFDEERGTDADVYYLRVQQAGGGMAWVGPLWVAPA